MEKAREIKQSMQEIFGVTPNLPITATVVSIQDDNTCTVKLINDLEVSDVRLKSTFSDSQDGLLIVPTVGSKVMVLSQTGGLSNLMVIKVDQVDKIQYIKEDLSVIIGGDGNEVILENGNLNLATLIDTLIQTISGLVLTTPAGPGAIAGNSIQDLTNIKGDFQKFFKPN